jgi:hypothetical protein
MKRIVRLTERDLTKLVKRVINEGAIDKPLQQSYLDNLKDGEKGTFVVSNLNPGQGGSSLVLSFSDGNKFVVYGD